MRTYFANLELSQFLRDYDHSLLVNRPKLWVIRLPYLALYALLANALVFLFILVLPLQLYHIQEFFSIWWMAFFASLIALYFWNRQFSLYSPEKAYENTSPLKGLADFLVYIACIMVLISPTIATSLTLYYRFDNMISFEEVELDNSRIRRLNYDDSYPEDLILKYTSHSSVTQEELNNYSVQMSVDQSIRRLQGIKDGDFNELQAYSLIYILVIHFGLLMFAGRHVTKRVYNRALVYGVIAFVLYSMYGVVLEILAFSPTFLGRLIEDIDLEIIGFPGPLIAFIIFMSIMAFSVFLRRERSDFAAMNIVLLPAGVFVYMIYWIGINIIEGDLYVYWEFTDTFWFGMLITSPFLYMWLIPLLKAMYMRVLALPEK